ncbi:hypothetical protein GV368_07250 [Tepidiphilus sp. B18-69]|uniref:Uncharacterized protein n=1 Tax=Tepidiphilus baoligensis TaxID=2698687 RepID=A0ABX1QNW0_9PROT|nr:hypothetical protein [Tepidiphilus baoligensis]NMH16899.1 hypothetical protein [Tepidiphilus baoligensis]
MAELPSSSGRFVRFPGSPFELFQPYPPAGTSLRRSRRWYRVSATG